MLQKEIIGPQVGCSIVVRCGGAGFISNKAYLFSRLHQSDLHVNGICQSGEGMSMSEHGEHGLENRSFALTKIFCAFYEEMWWRLTLLQSPYKTGAPHVCDAGVASKTLSKKVIPKNLHSHGGVTNKNLHQTILPLFSQGLHG